LGGSHFVVWKHLRPDETERAIDLVKFLTSAEIELTLLDDVGYIPASIRALGRIPANSIYAAAVESVRKARPFRHIRMWGVVEEKLGAELSKIWQALLSTPNPDVSQIIADHLDPIETSLNQMLVG
jgi:ABC-type glycerol-3-phosphate transport system substrate-binding protein